MLRPSREGEGGYTNTECNLSLMYLRLNLVVSHDFLQEPPTLVNKSLKGVVNWPL